MDVGHGVGCVDRAATFSGVRTHVSGSNKADEDATVDQITLRCNNIVTGIEFGCFTDNGLNSLTCLATHNANGMNESGVAGCETYDAGDEFTAFLCDTDEYIGLYHAVGKGERDDGGGDGYWSVVADYIGAGDTTEDYTWNVSGSDIELYGTGAAVGGAVAPTSVLQGPLFGSLGGPI